MKRQYAETEDQANKKRHLSPLTISTLDALALHTIFTFIDDDLSTQLAFYGTCNNIMTFVMSEKTIPLNGVLQLKKFTEENNFSKIALHYRMCGVLHQYAWLQPDTPVDMTNFAKDLPQYLSQYCKNGLIEAVYAFKDDFYGGGFVYLEVAVKKINSNEKFRLKFTNFNTIHGRGFDDVETLDISIDNSRVYNGSGIVDEESWKDFTTNAEICKDIKGAELINSLFGISITEDIFKEGNSWYDSPVFSPLEFERTNEVIINNFVSELVDMKSDKFLPLINSILSTTLRLCNVKPGAKKVKQHNSSDNEDEEEKEEIEEEEEQKEKKSEMELFEFLSLVKHNISYVNFDEYTSYGREDIQCKLKRKDNEEVVNFSAMATTGPSYTGTYVELELLINNEVAFAFNMEEGTISSNFVQDNLKELVKSFANVTNNPRVFANELLEFILENVITKWAVYSCYEMDQDKTGLTITDGYPSEIFSEVLEYFCEHIDDETDLIKEDEDLENGEE